jgi:hypothetical protein
MRKTHLDLCKLTVQHLTVLVAVGFEVVTKTGL